VPLNKDIDRTLSHALFHSFLYMLRSCWPDER